MESQINPPDPSDPKCYADSIKAPNLVGTWNIINVTAHQGRANATAGAITFTKEPYPFGGSDTWNYTENVNNSVTNGGWNFNDPTNTMVNLCVSDSSQNKCLYLTFKIITPSYVELQDSSKNIIELRR